ncbi:hypothetical protein Golomagni_05075 [Golovinomyces magnicellulatus]|nr:hypothetical protein Golomagni_05075 [Golovinomyces magnicellulatus]
MASDDHKKAKFVPISPGLDLHTLVQRTENIDYVWRLSKDKLNSRSIGKIEALVTSVVVQGGKPLVIEGWGSSLPSPLFSSKWLEENHGSKEESVRDIPNEVNIPMTIGHYLRSMKTLTNQFTPTNYMESRHQRLYLKDIDCPEAWADHLKSIIPKCVYYLNDCIEYSNDESNSPCELNNFRQNSPNNIVAPAGDLMSSLPPEMRASNLMCYIGHDGTYTAAHREMCATLGHNIMIEASGDNDDEREGSSIWFMTESNERSVVREYFSAVLGHDVEVEKHFAQVNAWKNAPFKVWVVEQKVGDLIIIPPLAPHQVWNRGTRTIKAAWNRTTVDTLELALKEALFSSRMVCRDEQYRCKAIVFYSLQKYYRILQQNEIEEKSYQHKRKKQLLDDFKRLFFLYQDVIISEMFSLKLPEQKSVEMLPQNSGVTCSYCRCDIFNRFLTCRSCSSHDSGESSDTYDICMDCYAMGRSCRCISNLSWVEQWEWRFLEDCYELWRNFIIRFYNGTEILKYFQPLQVARMNYGKKSIAQICQEQLKRRPWKRKNLSEDMKPYSVSTKSKPIGESRQRPLNWRKELTAHRLRKGISKLANVKRYRCHICRRYELNWKMAFCSTCNLAYCYSTLWYEFDLMPQTVMADNDWHCPRCLNTCSCKDCQENLIQIPLEPIGTILGHNTKKVADHRSVESLVDFSRSKLVLLYFDPSNPQQSIERKLPKDKVVAEIAHTHEYESLAIEDEDEDANFLTPDETNRLESMSMKFIDPFLRDLSTST